MTKRKRKRKMVEVTIEEGRGSARSLGFHKYRLNGVDQEKKRVPDVDQEAVKIQSEWYSGPE